MAHSGALSSAPSRLGLASCHNSSQPWGVWEWGLPVRIGYCAGSDSLILDTKTKPSKEDEGKLQSWTKVLKYFWISGAFSNSHIPCPSPHPTNNVGRMFPEFFFSQFELCIGRGRENNKKISKRMYSFMVACVQTPPSLLFSCCNSCLFWALNAIHRSDR